MTHEHSSRDWHGAHHPWAYRQQCFRWLSANIVGINFLPLATEMRAWFLQNGYLSLPPEKGEEGKGGYSNPYTCSAGTLGLILSQAVNSWHDYANSNSFNHNEIDAEIQRLRIYNEIILYAARFCEALIKQLLYCTQIPEKQFSGMALGALLESPCPSCKKTNGAQPHTISMVGTLAHPFHLCLEFEHCAMNHMDLVNKLRNNEAAHSDIQNLDVQSVAVSKARLAKDCNEVLSGVVHMLSHLEKLELYMLKDLTQKGNAIMQLKLNGLAAENCNFHLVPGQPVVAPNSVR